MSFKRAGAASASSSRKPGVKPWLNGQYMVSSGLRQLDTILGGGIVLGTTLLLEEDVHSDHARTLLAYSMAEATSQGHKVLLIGDMEEKEVDQMIQSLPYNLSLNNEKLPEAKAANKDASAAAASHLKIAWQYQKYLSTDTDSAAKATSERPRVSVSDNYCCSYDLARRMQPQLLEQHPLTVISLCNESPGTVLERVRTFLDANSTTVCQVVLPSIQRCDHIETDVVTDRLRLFLAVKHLVRERMASCLLTIQPTELPARMLSKFENMADTCLRVESFAGRMDSVPYEFREFVGFLHVRKLQSVKSLAPHRPDNNRYGMKRDRRKLHIEPLHLPPEESRATVLTTAEMEGKGHEHRLGPRKQTPMLACASTGGAGTDDLDF